MIYHRILFILGLITSPAVHALWSCSENEDCSSLAGSICVDGDCRCPYGQQSVSGGAICADLAPYHTSTCVEDHQCSRMFTAFVCRRDGEDADHGVCWCQPGHHYFLGRCWQTIDYGAPCTRNEQCLSVLRDMHNLVCEDICICADGYYERQRGECRKIGYAVGDACVLDDDCQFPGGACDNDFVCYDVNAPEPADTTEETAGRRTNRLSQIIRNNTKSTSSAESKLTSANTRTSGRAGVAARSHGAGCGFTSPCVEPFECSSFGACVCSIGYYWTDGATGCLAELGSPSTPAQCAGLFAEVRDGVCTCQVNFYFDENMRDCIKATRSITDACVTDFNCHTFGTAARCGAPQPPWGLRTCECVPEQAVWDAGREMCRLFAGIGEECLVDSDCLAGELEIHCVHDDAGVGTCACPDGYVAQDGLCLTTGLDLGDACQVTVECTERPNLACENGHCSCDSTGYQEVDGYCAPIIGGVCVENSDCVIDDTVCSEDNGTFTCQCGELFVEYEQECWPVVPGINATCDVDAQCEAALSDTSHCHDGHCVCIDHYHYRDEGCWPITDLFETCQRTSQCYLAEGQSERVLCRNSLCQCHFDYPFDEELHTCTSSATSIAGSLLVVPLLYLSVS